MDNKIEKLAPIVYNLKEELLKYGFILNGLNLEEILFNPSFEEEWNVYNPKTCELLGVNIEISGVKTISKTYNSF